MSERSQLNKEIELLIVDDEPDFLEQAEIFLSRENDLIKPETVTSTDDALDKLDEEEFDCVVSDYQMPGLDGLELLKVVREDRGYDIPFIIFTGKGREEVAMDALNLGANRYIQKGGDVKTQYGVLTEAILQEISHRRSELERKKIKAELSSLIKGSDDPIYIVDSDGKFLFANQSELDKLDLQYEELIGSNFRDFHTEEEANEFIKCVKKVLKTGNSQRQESEIRDSGDYYVRTFSPVRNPETGEIDRVSVISKDISDRKEMERNLRQYKMAIEESKDMVAAINEDYEYIFVNKKFLKYHNVKKDNVIGKRVDEVLSNEAFKNMIKPKVNRCLKGERIQYEMQHNYPDLGKRYLSVYYYPLKRNNDIYGVVSIIEDNTEQRKSIKNTERLRREYEDLFNGLNDPVLLINLDGKIIKVNDAASELLNKTNENLVNSNIKDITAEESKQEVDRKISQIQKEGNLIFETNYVQKNGQKLPVEINAKKIDYRGKTVILSVIRDLTERKKLEYKKELFATSLNEASIEVYWINSNGDLEYTNKVAKDKLGYTEKELKKMKVSDIDPNYPQNQRKEQWSKVKTQGRTNFKSKHITKDGEKYPVEITSQYLEHNNEEYELAFAIDISEREEAQKKYELLFQNSPVAIWEQDFSELKKYLDKLRKNTDNLKNYLRNNSEEIQNCVDKINVIDVNDYAINFYDAKNRNELVNNLSNIFTEESKKPLINQFLAIAKNKTSFKSEEKIKTLRGNEKHVIFEINVPKDYQEDYSRVYVTVMDITERKRIEEEQEFLHSLLRHDVKNKAQIIQGYLQLIQSTQLTEEQKKYISKSKRSNQKAINLIDKVRKHKEIEEKNSVETEKIKIGPIIDKIISEYENRLKERNIKLKLEISNCQVKGNSLIEDIFSNLIENSIKHSRCDKLKIETNIHEEYCQVIVEDDGIGIPEDIRDNIFEKGFKQGRNAGSGLGMHIIKEIIGKFDGRIEIKNSELGGARFDIFLRRSNN